MVDFVQWETNFEVLMSSSVRGRLRASSYFILSLFAFRDKFMYFRFLVLYLEALQTYDTKFLGFVVGL